MKKNSSNTLIQPYWNCLKFYFKTGLALTLFLLLTLGFAGYATEELIVPDDFSTIQKAINEAGNGARIIVKPGLYKESIDFKGKSITLESTDPENPETVKETTIDGSETENSVVIFRNNETKETILSGFTIREGSGFPPNPSANSFGCGVLVVNSSPVIKNNIIKNNGYGYGGGLFVGYNSSASIKDNTFENNQSYLGAGVLVAADSSPTISNNLFRDNKGHRHGGAIAVEFSSSPLIKDNEIHDNTACSGGGIMVTHNCSPKIINNEIKENYGSCNGGGLKIEDHSSAIVRGNKISNNDATTGGGINIVNASPNILDNKITNNVARDHGGALKIRGPSRPIIKENEIVGNISKKEGGAIVSLGSSPQVIGNVFSDNTAKGDGGAIFFGIYHHEDVLPIVRSNEFRENQAGGRGGAIYARPRLLLSGKKSGEPLTKPYNFNTYIDNQPGDVFYNPHEFLFN
ncbi:right-handed parallel beta-helix repeat-containing protein [Candidatus Bipolaricaulota bacterium]|nr:right-handed parallel beta-helix repeat-containing protein [Candidatus Bipolaricaulota bacterium]